MDKKEVVSKVKCTIIMLCHPELVEGSLLLSHREEMLRLRSA